MAIYMSLSYLFIWLSCRSFPSGYLDMIPSRVFFSWGCVPSEDPYIHTSPSPLLITGLVVVLWIPILGGSSVIGCFLYFFWWFSSCDTWSCWYQIPTIFLNRWPDCGWRNQLHYMWDWCIRFPKASPVLFLLPSMVLHSSLSFLVARSLSHFPSAWLFWITSFCDNAVPAVLSLHCGYVWL